MFPLRHTAAPPMFPGDTQRGLGVEACHCIRNQKSGADLRIEAGGEADDDAHAQHQRRIAAVDGHLHDAVGDSFGRASMDCQPQEVNFSLLLMLEQRDDSQQRRAAGVPGPILWIYHPRAWLADRAGVRGAEGRGKTSCFRARRSTALSTASTLMPSGLSMRHALRA